LLPELHGIAIDLDAAELRAGDDEESAIPREELVEPLLVEEWATLFATNRNEMGDMLGTLSKDKKACLQMEGGRGWMISKSVLTLKQRDDANRLLTEKNVGSSGFAVGEN
jgi:hypothetical protein